MQAAASWILRMVPENTRGMQSTVNSYLLCSSQESIPLRRQLNARSLLPPMDGQLVATLLEALNRPEIEHLNVGLRKFENIDAFVSS
jgi:hypothetical protein